MARGKKGGWAFVPNRLPYAIRFSHQGQRVVISTGESDPKRAATEGDRLYAQWVHGKRRRVARQRRAIPGDLAMLFAEWLASLDSELAADTIETYKTTYVRGHFLKAWKTLGEIHDGSVADYARAALRRATRDTMLKEVGALFKFLAWCVEQGHLDEEEIPRRPRISPKATGTRTGPQREHAPEYSREELLRAVNALPWRSGAKGKGFPVRARFVVAYETGLRPATIDAIRADDVNIKDRTLTIRDEDDKGRLGRVVPLSDRALTALGALMCPHDKDPIFGEHDYRYQLARAARAAGLPSLSPYDFRHGRITHLQDAGAPITGVMHLVGHTQVSTTSKYTHPSMRAAREALGSDLDQEGPMMSAKEGSRTPTRVTPLEPESGENVNITRESQNGPGQESAGSVRESQNLGSADPSGFPLRAATAALTLAALEAGHEVVP